MAAVFELYRADGTLQLDLSSSLPQTLGVIDLGNYLESNTLYASGTVPIPGWAGGKRGWFVFEGVTAVSSVWCPTIYRTGDSLYFRYGRMGSTVNPRIKYGVY